MKTAVCVLALANTVAFSACPPIEDGPPCECRIVEINADKRQLFCGQRACVGGIDVSCDVSGATQQDGVIEQHGACKACTSSSSSSGGTSSSSSSSSSTSSSGSADDSCSHLATYCATRCKAPEAVNKSCTDAVADGNGSECLAWQASNASLCKHK